MVKIIGYGQLMNQIYMFVCYFIYLQRKNHFCMLSVLQTIRTRFGNKPIFTDSAHWYNDACRWLRLKHVIYGTELKNIMERFIQQIKDRTECFDDNFPCRTHKCNRQHVDNWIRLYLLYLHMKTDRVKFIDFVIRNSLS